MSTDYSALTEKKLSDKELGLAAKFLTSIFNLVEEDEPGTKKLALEEYRSAKENFNHNIDAIIKTLETEDESTETRN